MRKEQDRSPSAFPRRQGQARPGKGTHPKPDVNLLDLADLALGVKRVAQLERRFKRLPSILLQPDEEFIEEGLALRGAGGEGNQEAHLLLLEHVHHTDRSLQLWYLLLEPVPPREAGRLHKLVLAVAGVRSAAGFGHADDGWRARERLLQGFE